MAVPLTKPISDLTTVLIHYLHTEILLSLKPRHLQGVVPPRATQDADNSLCKHILSGGMWLSMGTMQTPFPHFHNRLPGWFTESVSFDRLHPHVEYTPGQLTEVL